MCNIDTDSSYVLVYLYGVLCCDVSQNVFSIFYSSIFTSRHQYFVYCIDKKRSFIYVCVVFFYCNFQ